MALSSMTGFARRHGVNGAYGWAVGGSDEQARVDASMRQCVQQGRGTQVTPPGALRLGIRGRLPSVEVIKRGLPSAELAVRSET